MDEVRRTARTAAHLAWLAEQYREQARRDSSKRPSLEVDAAALDRFAASLLILIRGGVTGGALAAWAPGLLTDQPRDGANPIA